MSSSIAADPALELLNPFVGRARELAELEAAVAGAVAGAGAFMLVSGEAGIGKTRLVEELGRRAARAGVRVVWGRCWEAGGAPAFWPWVEVLRPLLTPSEARSLADAAADAPSFSRLIPHLAPAGRKDDVLAALPEDRERFLVFDSVTRFLVQVASGQALLVALDDLHAADLSSLLLLEFATRRLSGTRILVVGTHRSFEAVGEPEAARAFERVARQARCIPLGGLSELEVSRYLTDGFRLHPSEASVTALHRATDGNPFFLDEVVRVLLADGGGLGPERLAPGTLALPRGVREAARRRLEGLSAETRAALSTASLIGREFDVDLLEAVTGSARADLLGALAEAGRARVVVRLPGDVGRWRFAHGLVRNAFAEALEPAERAERHRRIGVVLAAHAGSQPPLAEIAAHFCEAAVGGGALAEAVDWSARAADAALASLAYEDAVAHYRRALGLLERTAADEPRRCRLLVALGNALAKAGDEQGASGAFTRAAELARRLDLPRAFAEAALGCSLVYIWHDMGRPDEELQRLMEEALERLPETDSALRAALMASLSVELYWTGTLERRLDLAGRAASMAQRVREPSVVAYALSARHQTAWGPGDAEERLAIADEVVRVAEASGHHELGLRGRIFRVIDRLELDDVPGAEREIAEYARRAERLQQPFYQWHLALWRAMQATLAGRFDDGERLAASAFEIGRGAQNRNALHVFGAQSFLLGSLRGRFADLEPMAADAVAQYPVNAAWRCALAYVRVELGKLAPARADLERLAEGEFAGLARDVVWPIAVAFLARVCATLGDARAARVLCEQARPFASRNVVAAPGAAFFGTMSQYVGLLAATAGLLAEAAGHYADAIDRLRRLGALPFLALAEADQAALFLARGGAGDRARAEMAADRAAETARRLGMEALAARAEALGRETRTVSGPAAPAAGVAASSPAAGAAAEIVFRRDGDYWTVGSDGRAFRLRDAIGLRYLARLLAHPGVEVHVLDLVASADGRRARADAPAAAGAMAELVAQGLTPSRGEAGLPILDAPARDAYRRRLEDLRAELAEAQAFNDPGRSARAEQEIEFLAAELARAHGLGGRERRTASGGEQARINVTKRIKLAIRRIEEHDPALARCLATTVRTGTFCCYAPDPRLPVVWRLA